jgi:deazaflavin-dependent oxidoreductase (nitroreductase family)
MANDWNTGVIEEFRANEGRVGGNFEGASMVLITTTGAKSGLARTSPLVYLADEANPNRIFIFASKGGAPTSPDWYHNLLAHPTATVEVGADKYDAVATVMTGPERDEIYAKQVTRMPGFGDYQQKTTRVVPVVALTRK